MHLRTALHERYGGDRIIGQTPGIRRAIELGLSVADTQTTVLIEGESGTGKELLANLIHYNSGREDQPYIKLNCGAIPETLLESERSEEHTSELQSLAYLVCRLLLEKKKLQGWKRSPQLLDFQGVLRLW